MHQQWRNLVNDMPADQKRAALFALPVDQALRLDPNCMKTKFSSQISQSTKDKKSTCSTCSIVDQLSIMDEFRSYRRSDIYRMMLWINGQKPQHTCTCGNTPLSPLRTYTYSEQSFCKEKDRRSPSPDYILI
jgi:hypothetical protein